MKFSLAILLATVAYSQPYPATFVATYGNGAGNGCGTALSPCQSWADAILNTLPYGTITALDAGDFGLITTYRPVTIDGAGLAFASNSTSQSVPFSGSTLGKAAIVVNNQVGDPSLPNFTVKIKRLTIAANHLSPGALKGVTFQDGIGIYVTGARLELEDVLISGGIIGVFGSANDQGFFDLNMNRSTVTGAAGTGVYLLGGVTSIRDSNINANGTGLYQSAGGAAGTGTTSVEHSELSLNVVGIGVEGANGPSTVRLSNSVLTGNTNLGVIAANGGQLISFRNNIIAGNTTDGTPTSAVSAK
jgi:hypothetical protein